MTFLWWPNLRLEEQRQIWRRSCLPSLDKLANLAHLHRVNLAGPLLRLRLHQRDLRRLVSNRRLQVLRNHLKDLPDRLLMLTVSTLHPCNKIWQRL